MKEYGVTDACFVDFHYCQGAIGTDIETIRDREVGTIISKPWLVKGDNLGEYPMNELVSCDKIEEFVRKLNTCTRSNIKGLLDSVLNSESELFTELSRMQLRRKTAEDNDDKDYEDITKTKGEDGEVYSREMLRKIIYDIVSVYDLWFKA